MVHTMPKLSWLIMLGAFVVGGMLGWLVGNEQDATAPTVALSATTSPDASVPATAITTSTPEVRIVEPSRDAESIAVVNGRLSARVHDMPMATFIDSVSRAANIPIMVGPNDTNQLVSIEVADVPVGEALVRALPRRDVLLLHGGNASDHPLQAVWVWPQNQGRSFVRNDTGPSRAALHDTEPGVRAAAIEEVAWRGLPGAANIVAEALADGDSSVRERALNASVVHNVDLAIDQLLRLLQGDTAPAVRLAALRAFARTAALDRDAVRSAAQYAVNDADPSVQSAAHEILAHVTAMENAINDFDLLTMGNNADVSETPADSAP